MCAYYCPCKSSMTDPWLSMSEAELNTYGRTKAAIPPSAPGVINEKDSNGNYYFYTDSDGVESYAECVAKVS